MSDNSFSISTSQNVSISYEVAGIGERVLAYIIDFFVKAGYICVLIFIGFLLSEMGSNVVMVVILIIFVMPLMFYTLLFETFMQGQTPGKKARKIKVVKIDGEQATFSSFLIRWLFLFVDVHMFYAMIGIVTIAVNKKGQRVGDIVAGTTVIKIRDTTSLKDTIYEKLQQTHQVTYQEVSKLSVEDIELVKKVLNTPEYRDNYDMFYTLTNKIQAKMDVMRREASSEEFLRTVVRDYNSLNDE